MKTKVVTLKNGDVVEKYLISSSSGADTGDLIYDFSEKKFHPVYKLGNTNMCFEPDFQSKIHKVIKKL